MSDDKRPQLSPWPCPMPRAPSSSLPKALDANPSADADPSGWWSQSWPEPWAKHLCSPAISLISGISFSTRAHQKSSGVGALAPPCLPSPGSTFGSLVLALTQAPLGAFSLYGFQVHIRLFSSQCYSQEDHSGGAIPLPGRSRAFCQAHSLKSPLEAWFKALLLRTSVSSGKVFNPLNFSIFICKTGIIIVPFSKKKKKIVPFSQGYFKL